MRISRELEIGLVVVPRHPGCLSATGIVVAPIAHDYVRALGVPADSADPEFVAAAFAELRARGAADLELDGVDPASCDTEPALGMRYRGQTATLSVTVAEPITPALLTETVARFHRLHRETYGYNAPGDAVEAVDARLRIAQPPAPPRSAARSEPAPVAAPAPAGLRTATFDRGPVEVAVHQRRALVPGTRLAGPAVVEEYDSTTLLPPGATGRVDALGNLIITVDGG